MTVLLFLHLKWSKCPSVVTDDHQDPFFGFSVKNYIRILVFIALVQCFKIRVPKVTIGTLKVKLKPADFSTFELGKFPKSRFFD